MKTINDIIDLIAELLKTNEGKAMKYSIAYDAEYNWIHAKMFNPENKSLPSTNEYFNGFVLRDEADVQIVYWTLFKLKR